MRLSEEQSRELGVACNEATWIGLEVSCASAWAGVTLEVLSLPEGNGPAPEDGRVQLILQDLRRVAASFRDGNWNDKEAKVLPLTREELEAQVLWWNGNIRGCALRSRRRERLSDVTR